MDYHKRPVISPYSVLPESSKQKRTPKKSGRHIYDTIVDKKKELDEIKNAAHLIERDIGTTNPAYKVITDRMTEVQKELDLLLNTFYEVSK